MRLTGCELYSADLVRSREFYRNVLGLALAEEDMCHHVMFDGGNAFLCLETPGAENYPSHDKAALFFEVSDLAREVDRIGPHRFVKLDLEGSSPWAVLHDPDGHNVLLLEDRKRQGGLGDEAGVSPASTFAASISARRWSPDASWRGPSSLG